MPKIVTKSKTKINLDIGNLDDLNDLVKMLSGDPDFIGDIAEIYERIMEFNTALHAYMQARFNLGKVISTAYTEAGTRVINDNQLIITPIKSFLGIMNKCKGKFIGTLEQDEDSIRLFKKTYFDFKKSKTIMDAIVICNNLTSDKEFHEMENILIFKNLSEYESENLNLKFIFADVDISQELKDDLSKQLKELQTVTSNIHRLYNSPDIDIQKVFPKLMGMLDTVLGDLKGCKESRALLKKCSGLFSENFATYFQNFQVTESPFGIIEDFISDVIADQKQNTKLNAKILTELSTIMSTLRKKVSKLNAPILKNKKISKVMNMVENALHNFSSMGDKNDTTTEEDVQQKMSEVVNFLSSITGEDLLNPDQSENNTNA